MTSILLDIVPQILQYLGPTTLELCCLVNTTFRSVSQELLFSDLVLTDKTWRKKCQFLLGGTGDHLTKRVRNVTLQTDNSSILNNIPIASEMVSLLTVVGPQLRGLKIIGAGEWTALAPAFKDCLANHVLPHILWLELYDVFDFPLMDVLESCDRLQSFDIGARYGGISYEVGPPPGTDQISRLPRITSFSLSGFEEADLLDDMTVGQYLDLAGSSITFWHLGGQYCRDFPLALDFLPPMEALRINLQHLSFGPEVYSSVVIDYNEEPEIRYLLPLSTFPNLGTLTFGMWLPSSVTPNQWSNWFAWVARNLSQEAPTSLTNLQFKIDYLDYPPSIPLQTQDPAFSALASNSNLKIRCTVNRRHGNTAKRVNETVDLFRVCLEAWEEKKRMEILVFR